MASTVKITNTNTSAKLKWRQKATLFNSLYIFSYRTAWIGCPEHIECIFIMLADCVSFSASQKNSFPMKLLLLATLKDMHGGQRAFTMPVYNSGLDKVPEPHTCWLFIFAYTRYTSWPAFALQYYITNATMIQPRQNHCQCDKTKTRVWNHPRTGFCISYFCAYMCIWLNQQNLGSYRRPGNFCS